MTSNRWLSCPKTNPTARVRLFCFPYSGAAASIYYPWAEVLPSAIEVCPIQLPGRGARLREPLVTRLDALVEAVAGGLAPAFDRPFAFFGHSMGALISFELALALRRAGRPGPLHIFVSGRGAAHLPERNPPLHQLPEPEFVAKLRELNGTPEEVLRHAELLQLMIPILRADFEVCETYVHRPEPPLSCPLSAYGGLGDDFVSKEELAAWQEQTSGRFSVRMFPGDHFYLSSARLYLLQTLAREIDQTISPRT